MSIVPKGDRRLGVYVCAPESGDYTASFDLAKSWGIRLTTLALDWSTLETAPGVYDATWLDIAEAFYPPNGCALDLILRPVNTNRAEVPADLAGLAWDDPALFARFASLLDFVLARIPSVTINALAVGNEVDVLFGSDPAAYSAYRTFFEAARSHARSLRPGLAVGVVAQMDGLIGAAKSALLGGLNTNADAILATYYPLRINGSFVARRPSEVRGDFDALAALYPGRPIVFTEAGYPSGRECGGSEVLQTAFVREMFAAWDSHAEQIKAITYSWLTDLSAAEVATFVAYYGIADPTFASFLGTLGLRTWGGTGTDKRAVRALRWEAAVRGW